MDYFITGGDNTCIMDNATGDICVIGATGVNEHKNNVDGSRGYITLYWTRTAYVSTGPTMFLLVGNIPRRGFNSNFIMKYGAAMGSAIIMTDTAYMKTKAWEDMTPKLTEG